ncbi:MAG: class I SAM-dependent methyltransferase [Candidatus Eremiobacteraeota bacterium]|nr:class I SAM-dependent methyltransferase [Candidatus Eremiobacteraeota bacterium]
MSKQGEIDYLKSIGPDHARHAAGKPFSDVACGWLLQILGGMISLLPPPPGRLLDLGCGSGWTSVFFAKIGYDVTGLDLAPDMIELANDNKARDGLTNLTFAVGDFEALAYDAEFDCVTLYDTLHHSEDERAVLRGAYRALRPGGVCVTSEPGHGHENNPVTRAAIAAHNVTERDMPPSRIVAAGSAAGFATHRVYPHPVDVRRNALRRAKWLIESVIFKDRGGYVVLGK